MSAHTLWKLSSVKKFSLFISEMEKAIYNKALCSVHILSLKYLCLDILLVKDKIT